MKCEMCLSEFPLGLALGTKVNGRNDWLYQIAGHVPPERLSEALPVMAALQVLCSRSYGKESMIPFMLGWEVRGPGLTCEVDIAAVLDYRGRPALVVGEVKSHRDPIDVNDLTNLSKIQHHVREQGVDCFVLAAVMRELREDEISVLRDFAQRPPLALAEDSAIEPVLPIVLTEQNLSATRFGQHHPSSWSPADGVLGLATESCRQNLGMADLEPDQDQGGFYPPPPVAAAWSGGSFWSSRPGASRLTGVYGTRPPGRLAYVPYPAVDAPVADTRRYPAHRRRAGRRRRRPRRARQTARPAGHAMSRPPRLSNDLPLEKCFITMLLCLSMARMVF